MAEPKVVFNQAGGSDTLSSGAGPGDGTTAGPALNGALANTGGVASTTISLPPLVDLTNVATDGSHMIYMVTASGRRFSKITAKAGSGGATPTLVVGDSFTIAAPGVNWAIGGKRSTLEDAGSRQLGLDYKAGCTVCVEDDGGVQVLSSPFNWSVAGSTSAPGWILITGGSKASKPLIRGTHNGVIFNFTSNRQCVRWFRFDNTNATKTASVGVHHTNTTAEFWIYECDFGDATNKLWRAVTCGATPSFRFEGCEMKYLADVAFDATFSGAIPEFYNCNIHHCAGAFGVRFQGGSGKLIKCKIWANTSKGFEFTNAGGPGGTLFVEDNTFDGNGSHGMDLTNAVIQSHINVVGNQFTNNGGYGVQLASGSPTSVDLSIVDRNNYYNNTSGARNRFRAGDTDYASDPLYVDRTNGDFRTQESSLQGKGYADAATMGASHGPEIGAATYAGAGGDTIVLVRKRVVR